MGRGIVESGLFRSERYELEQRTTDPSSTSEGEMWIRTDLAPDTNQLATLRFDAGGSIWDLPIYDVAASTKNVEKVWNVQVAGVTGFVPITDDNAAHPALRYQHNGADFGVHDALEASGIPSSTILQSPIYRFLYPNIGVSDGTQNFSIPDDLNNIPDATVASGTVTYRKGFNGVSGGDYPAGAYHSWNPGSNQPTGNENYTVMALVYVPDTSSDTHLFGWGDPNGGDTDKWGLVVRDGDLIHFTGDLSNDRGGAVPQGAWFSVMTHWDNGPNNLTGYLNGSQVIQDAGILDRTHVDTAYRIGFAYNAADKQKYVADLVVSDVVESDSAYQQYHNEWMDYLNN